MNYATTAPDAAPATPASRLFFLDWIRILAFFLLIFYHTGMYYVTWDFHIKSPHASTAIEPLMLLSGPWRLGLLFMISGVASAFLLSKIRIGQFFRQRSVRLLVPLIFGMLVIVPPQSYFQVVERMAYLGGYGDFMRLYVTGYHGFCEGDKCLGLPTWNHLWFVVYLWVYSMLLGAVALIAGPLLKRSGAWLGNALTGWKIVVLPTLVLAAARFALYERFPSTHALFGDWYNHADYIFLFLMGVLLATQARFWANVDRMRWTTLGLSLAGWAIIATFLSMPEIPAVMVWKPVARLTFAMCQWTPILAVCGFGHRHLNFDSAKRRYLTEAVFPVYILHQTLIICWAHWLKPADMAPAMEGTIVIVLTLTFSFGIFEIVRRVPRLRPFFGLGRLQPAAKKTEQPAPMVAAV
jgi:surface polysaccharide O-acyltransferase-like enzyme